MLPPGQKPRDDFPRFGLPQYTNRFPSNITDTTITIEINGSEPVSIDLSSTDLDRYTIQADFHCVTTWSYRGAEWSGYRFSDVYNKFIAPHETSNNQKITGAVFNAQDKYTTSLLLEDLLNNDVLLADTLDGQPLSIEHGAPIRLVAPAHYGYKNLKHLVKIKFYPQIPVIKGGIRSFLDHPRARVNKEERSRWVPGWAVRYLYRMLIPGTAKDFRVAMEKFNKDKSQE